MMRSGSLHSGLAVQPVQGHRNNSPSLPDTRWQRAGFESLHSTGVLAKSHSSGERGL